jgi:hypothetical protein
MRVCAQSRGCTPHAAVASKVTPTAVALVNSTQSYRASSRAACCSPAVSRATIRVAA